MPNGYRIVASTGLDRGDRDYQQDQVTLLVHKRQSSCLLGVLADGMGGRKGGRTASDQVMLTSSQLFERYDPGNDDPQAFLERLAQEAHTVIRLTAASSEEEPHSTVAAFLLQPNGACHWVHCGDSRLYHFKKGQLLFRTLDHSFVQTLVERGELTPEQAEHDARSNILLRCLGTEETPVTSHHKIDRVRAGDALLVCSDGLWHGFAAEELGKVVDFLTPREACEFLISKARERAWGASDNISLIVVKFEPLPVGED